MFTESRSVTSLKQYKSPNYIYRPSETHQVRKSLKDREVWFQRVPEHCRLYGHEMTDRATKCEQKWVHFQTMFDL